eukprot:10871836-Alexandrium_andersonii.AAC.1
MGPVLIDTLVSQRIGMLIAPGVPKRLADIGSLAGRQMRVRVRARVRARACACVRVRARAC